MSKSTLLRCPSSGQGLGSYGAVQDQELSLSDHFSDVENDEVDDVRRRGRRKDKNLAAFPSVSTENSESTHLEYIDTWSSQTRRRYARPGSGLAVSFTEPGDATGAFCGFPSGLPPFGDSGSEEDDNGEEA